MQVVGRTSVDINWLFRWEDERPILRVAWADPDTRVKRRPEGDHAVNIAVMQEEDRIEG